MGLIMQEVKANRKMIGKGTRMEEGWRKGKLQTVGGPRRVGRHLKEL